jgi:membrane protein
MMTFFRSALQIGKKTFAGWNAHNASRMGAALAYYSIFSLGPLLLITVSIAGFVFGEDAAREELGKYLTATFGESGAGVIQGLAQNAHQSSASGLASAIGVFVLMLAAIKVVMELEDALTQIWEVKRVRHKGIWGFLKKYVISVSAVLGIGFLLLVSLVLSTILGALGGFIGAHLHVPKAVLEIVNHLISLAGITFFFALAFKYLPRIKIAWSDVWIGAGTTALLFAIGKFLISLYLARQSLNSTYGAAASLVLVLLWVYYTAQILFLGAEFTSVYAHEYGSLKTRETEVLRSTKVRSR